MTECELFLTSAPGTVSEGQTKNQLYEIQYKWIYLDVTSYNLTHM